MPSLADTCFTSLIVAGTPYNVSGKTNLIKIEVVQDALKGEAKTFGE